MLDILIIQHEQDTPPGSLIDWVNSRGLSFSIWNISEIEINSELPYSLDGFKSLVVCGGSMNTFQEEQYPWLKIEKDFLMACVVLGKPIFGLCLGSQLLAEVLGGRVYSLEKWEIGFLPVEILSLNLNGSPTEARQLEVFQWHQCTFELPENAKLLATNNFCQNQAFIYGSNIVATQFHPEATVEWIQDCAQTEDLEFYQGAVKTKEEILSSISSLQEPLQAWFFKLLNLWFPVK